MYCLAIDLPRLPSCASVTASPSVNSSSTPASSTNNLTDKRRHAWCEAALKLGDIFSPVNFQEPLPSSIDSDPKVNSTEPVIESDYYRLHTGPDWRSSDLSIITVDMDPTGSVSTAVLKSKFLGHGIVRLYRGSDPDSDTTFLDKNSQTTHLPLVTDHAVDEDESDDVSRTRESNLVAASRNVATHVDDDTLAHNITSKSPNVASTRPSLAKKNSDPDADGTVMAILAVPGYLTPSDLLGFVGPNHCSHISHFRMIVTDKSNRYMVLLKFRDNESAKLFQNDYNGKLFNSMEPESCHVISISRILFGSEVTHSDDFPYLIEDDFTRKKRTQSISSSTRPPPPPPQSLKELPTCPVCLERMDSNITGLLTILCQHTFHCECLSKWADGSCPVCRYSQLPKVSHEHNRCRVCDSQSSLWICLICGHIGCGRYDRAHSLDHYVATGHCYAMDTQTQRVWDYAGDNYVHRLLQNEDDGKLVNTTTASSSGAGRSDIGEVQAWATVAQGSAQGGKEKGKSSLEDEEDLAMQYTRLLSSQLDSQRVYYEQMLTSAVDNAASANERVGQIETKLVELEKKLDVAQKQASQTLKLSQELESQKLKKEKLSELCHALQINLRDEQTMSSNIMKKVEKFEIESQAKDQKITELEEQVRDLMFFLEAQEKLKDAGEDVKEGSLSVGSKKKGKKAKK